MNGDARLARLLRRLVRSREFVMFLILVAMCAVVAVFSHDTATGDNAFLDHYNLRNLLRRISFLTIVGIGETFVIITGGIDLSVGSLIAFTGVVLALLADPDRYGLPLPAAVALVLLLCAGIGLAHGLVVTKLRVPPFVTTLASLCLLRGLAKVFSNTVPIPIMHDSFGRLGNGSIFLGTPDARDAGFSDVVLGLPFPGWLDLGIPIPALFCLAVLVLTTVTMRHTIWGRYLYALGGSAETTRLSGVNVHRMVCAAYVVSALCAGLAGVLFSSYSGQGDPQDAQAYELNAIAAAVIGGCSLMGGAGSMIGTLIGASIFHTILNGLGLIVTRNASLWEGVVVGSVLLLAVTAAQALRRGHDGG